MDDQATTTHAQRSETNLTATIRDVCLSGWQAHEAFVVNNDAPLALHRLRTLRGHLNDLYDMGLLGERADG